MLWAAVRERAKQLRGTTGDNAAPLISEIMSLWFEENHGILILGGSCNEI